MSDTYNISIGSHPPTTASAETGSSAGAAAGRGITPQNLGLLGQVMWGGFSDGNFDQNDVAAMKAVAGRMFGDSADECSASSSGSCANEMSDADFMKAVDDIANQSDPGIGPGEKMMKSEAQRLVDGGGSAADKKAFLAEANKLLNNKDGNGDGPQDIDEVNDHEGTRLAGFTDSLLADNPPAASTSGANAANGLISDFIGNAYADGKGMSDTELQGLQFLLGADANADSSSGSGTSDSSSSGTYKSTASSDYSYNDLVKSMIYGNMERNAINNDSGKLALSYIDDDNDA
jgi:hypothetical protein